MHIGTARATNIQVAEDNGAVRVLPQGVAIFSTLNSRLLHRSFLMRLLQTTGLSLALMTASAAGVRAADSNVSDTEIGAGGTPGIGDPFS